MFVIQDMECVYVMMRAPTVIVNVRMGSKEKIALVPLQTSAVERRMALGCVDCYFFVPTYFLCLV